MLLCNSKSNLHWLLNVVRLVLYARHITLNGNGHRFVADIPSKHARHSLHNSTGFGRCALSSVKSKFPKVKGSWHGRRFRWGDGTFSVSSLKIIAVNILDSLVNLLLFIPLLQTCVSRERVPCNSPYCAAELIRSIYQIAHNRSCLCLCCSLHCTSWSLIKVNKLFIWRLFSRNVIWQEAYSRGGRKAETKRSN